MTGKRAGWGLQSTSRLVSDLNGDLMLIDGSGDAWLFSYDSSDQTYTTPVGEYGTLTGGNASGQYVYTNQYGTQYDYDLNGRLTQIVQLNGWTTLYNYSGGVLSNVITPDGGTTSLQYSGGLLSSIVEPGGRTVTLEHDGGNLTEIVDAAGYTRVMDYDGQHLLTEDQWNPYDTSFGYSTLGLLDSLTQSPVTYTIVSANSAQLLNNAGQPLAQMIDGLGDTTSYLLDSRGRVLEEIQPDGASAGWELDYYDNVIAYTDFDGLTTRYDYDDSGYTEWVNDQWVYVPPSGDLLWVSYPNYTYESYAYNAFNEVTQSIDPDGDITESQYDGQGELISQTIGYDTPQAATTHYTWSGGLMQTMTDADGNETVYAYAGLLLVSQVLYNAQHEEQSSDSYAYDAAGNPTLFVDGDGNTTQYQYDADNNLTQTIDPDGITTSQQFDAAGFEVSSLDGRGVESDFDYDAAGLETLLSTAAETNVSAYNAAGEQTLSVDADGNSTSYAFDSDGNATLRVQGYWNAPQKVVQVL